MAGSTPSIGAERRAWITAVEAAAELGVSRATLYAYVSRGLIVSRAQAGTRKRLYASADIARLRQAREPDPDRADARAALAFGMPVLDSAITRIADGRFFYRGRDVVGLARGASVETVAGLLWGDGAKVEPVALPDVDAPAVPPTLSGAIEALSRAEREDRAAHARTPLATRAVAARILAGTLRVWSGASDPGTGPLADRLARAWDIPSAAGAIRVALVCCADHELNASTFAVRVAASTGASPYAALISGLATLSGPRHGGQTPRTLALLAEAARRGDAPGVVAERLRHGEQLPGFGHQLYPEGDPRAHAILAALKPAPRIVTALAEAARDATGLHPNLDFGLAGLSLTHGLDADRATGLFAIGRTIGWLAHALEQYRSDTVIRPRARYIGPDPREDHAIRARL